MYIFRVNDIFRCFIQILTTLYLDGRLICWKIIAKNTFSKSRRILSVFKIFSRLFLDKLADYLVSLNRLSGTKMQFSIVFSCPYPKPKIHSIQVDLDRRLT